MSEEQFDPPQKRLKLDDEEAEVKTAGWSDLPNELKLMVISYMQDTTPFNFAQCSKQSHSLAVASGRLCSIIELKENWRSMCFAPDFPDYELHFKVNHHYSVWYIRFCGSINSTSIRVHYIENERTFHKFEEEGKLFEVISRHANKYLQLFKNCLEEFYLHVRCQAKSHLIRGITLPLMPKLRILEVSGTPRQLCLFKYKFVDFETVRRVRQSLRLPSTRFTFDQLVQLQSANSFIYLNDLTADDLNKYMKYWRDGKLSPNFNFIQILGGYSERNAKRKVISVNYDGLELEKINYDTRCVRSNLDKTQYVAISASTLEFTMHDREKSLSKYKQK